MTATTIRCELCVDDRAPCARHAIDAEIAAAMQVLAAALDGLGTVEYAATTRHLAAELVAVPGNRTWYRALCWARDRRAYLSDRPTPDVQSYRASLLAWGVRGMLLRTDKPAEARAWWHEQLAAVADLDPARAAQAPLPRGAQLSLGLGGAA